MSGERNLTLNVISQNMYLDKTRAKQGDILPQEKRVEPLVATLKAQDTSLDVVGIQEAYGNERYHNGKALAEACGHGPGVWMVHNMKPHRDSLTGRSGEHIGMFGSMVQSAEMIELGDNRRALVADIAGVAFVLIHFRAGASLRARTARKLQAEQLTDQIADKPDAVIFGDFNEPPVKFVAAARDELSREGFESVFSLTGQSHPSTFPSEPYREVYGSRIRLPLDDVLVRGDRVNVSAAKILPRCSVYSEPVAGEPPLAESDHDGVMATLSIAT